MANSIVYIGERFEDLREEVDKNNERPPGDEKARVVGIVENVRRCLLVMEHRSGKGQETWQIQEQIEGLFTLFNT